MTRYEKITGYVDSVIEGMDFKDMYRYIFDSMLYDIEQSHTDEEVDELYASVSYDPNDTSIQDK
tara:strand:- start:43 stop:234 length:192 start_codon:yes stop_codon:yes gene_type:complete